MSADPLAVAAQVGALFESLGLAYSVGGSLASSFSGEPRSTLDIDFLVSFEEEHAAAIAAALGSEFYVDERALARAARQRSSTNIIHHQTSIKVDIFAAGGTAMDGDVLNRRVRLSLGGEGASSLWVHTAEDILLQKLRWYRLGGGTSDRQWRDVLGLVRVQGGRMDRQYLETGAARLVVADLLRRALGE